MVLQKRTFFFSSVDQAFVSVAQSKQRKRDAGLQHTACLTSRRALDEKVDITGVWCIVIFTAWSYLQVTRHKKKEASLQALDYMHADPQPRLGMSCPRPRAGSSPLSQQSHPGVSLVDLHRLLLDLRKVCCAQGIRIQQRALPIVNLYLCACARARLSPRA